MNSSRRGSNPSVRKIAIVDDGKSHNKNLHKISNGGALSNDKGSFKGLRRIMDPRDVEDSKRREAQNNRRASVHYAQVPKVVHTENKTRTRRLSAPARSAPVIDDLLTNDMELTREERVLIANFRLQKQTTNEHYGDKNNNVQNQSKRRVSFLPSYTEEALSPLKEEDERRN
ncbi:uncharacterized protein LOC143471315 [Clavelina lepadiformis]|uniref:Uncharacterized protein n=1 Tax=Clavelina lepadiformis TaxID=159417 RepID=A0ABP0FSL6_CLALP